MPAASAHDLPLPATGSSCRIDVTVTPPAPVTPTISIGASRLLGGQTTGGTAAAVEQSGPGPGIVVEVVDDDVLEVVVVGAREVEELDDVEVVGGVEVLEVDVVGARVDEELEVVVVGARVVEELDDEEVEDDEVVEVLEDVELLDVVVVGTSVVKVLEEVLDDVDVLVEDVLVEEVEDEVVVVVAIVGSRLPVRPATGSWPGVDVSAV